MSWYLQHWQKMEEVCVERAPCTKCLARQPELAHLSGCRGSWGRRGNDEHALVTGCRLLASSWESLRSARTGPGPGARCKQSPPLPRTQGPPATQKWTHQLHLPHESVHTICTCHKKVYTSFAPATRNYTHHLHLPQVHELHLRYESVHIICTCHMKVYTPFAPATRKCTHHLHLPHESVNTTCTCHKKVYISFAPATRKYTSFAPATKKHAHH